MATSAHVLKTRNPRKAKYEQLIVDECVGKKENDKIRNRIELKGRITGKRTKLTCPCPFETTYSENKCRSIPLPFIQSL
jgi:hypothetical protein